MSMRVNRSLAALALTALILLLSGALAESKYDKYMEIIGTYTIDESVPSYRDYISRNSENRPAAEYVIDACDYSDYTEGGESVEPHIYASYEGMDGESVSTDEDTLIEYDITVSEAGFYDLYLQYFPCEGKATEIQRAFFIDGVLPYSEAALIEFSRVWTAYGESVEALSDGTIKNTWLKDNQGNDLKPSSVERPEWITRGLYDNNGYISERLSFYLTEGAHTISILSLREPMVMRRIILKNSESIKTYAEYKTANDLSGAKNASKANIKIEAENAVKTSSQMLYARQDLSSESLSPSSARYLLNNIIGGSSWRDAGQWIEWSFTAPEDGYYGISVHVNQNYVRGLDVYRKIYIDGEVPFSEFSSYPFSYGQSWELRALGDENGDYQIYLEKGSHTLRMEVVLGDMASIIERVQLCVLDLNSIYRQVIYITGVAPDKYRDYQIERSLPTLTSQLISVRAELSAAVEALKITAGNNSDKLTVLKTMFDQLDELIDDNERFTEVIASYKANVRACGNWISQVLRQPLALDGIFIHSPETEPSLTNDAWYDSVMHEISRLYYSFVIDYNQVGNVAESTGDGPVITLWVGTGRDQATVIKALIDEDFTQKTGINVNLKLVDMSALLRATLAGQGPDVAIQVSSTTAIAGTILNTGNDTPVNYGLRDAVLDLTEFDDYEEVARRFQPSALVPFSFGGSTYALPDTQTFPMMFYRKDILAEIGLEVPQTWDDVKVAMSVLSKNQMEFGMLPDEQIFAMLLYQNGGAYYTENGDRSLLDSDEAVSTFKRFCEYYTDYKLDRATSVEERFRTGECPLIISDYTTYNNLQVSAPDILGLWDFTLVPGTVDADGEISRYVGGTGLADIIMSHTEYPDECWEFLKWWTSEETQTSYGREMESLMGKSARVPTANKEALKNLSWPLAAYTTLSEQMEFTLGIPQVPGGYYTWRNVNNAFFTVTEDASNRAQKDLGATPREELTDKIYYINAEINYKRAEFGLPVADGMGE